MIEQWEIYLEQEKKKEYAGKKSNFTPKKKSIYSWPSSSSLCQNSLGKLHMYLQTLPWRGFSSTLWKCLASGVMFESNTFKAELFHSNCTSCMCKRSLLKEIRPIDLAGWLEFGWSVYQEYRNFVYKTQSNLLTQLDIYKSVKLGISNE